MREPAPNAHNSFPALVAFDLDDTLAPSKSPLPHPIAQALTELLDVRPVCIISGGRFQQFVGQVLDQMPTMADLPSLHLMPTCGTRYERYIDNDWHEVYAHDLDPVDRQQAIESLETRAKQLNLWEPDNVVAGPRIEDRGSQITYSALGQNASVAAKKAWDPEGVKREALRAAVAADVPGLEVRAGGSTSIDITRKGIDKAYGMRALAQQTSIPLDQMLFIGDRLQPGGNDYPVRTIGVPCHEVTGYGATLDYLHKLIPSLRTGKPFDFELLPLA